jgi:NAD(P)-dependent dehydrogenase (short-subunit alcohol dehydrogenase family)
VTGRLDGKRVILTDPDFYSGPGIVKVFEEEGAELFADNRDLTEPGAAEDLVASVGHVDILIANHARPYARRDFSSASTTTEEDTDEEMERLMTSIFYPMHRMIRAVLPQMLKRKKGKIVITSSIAAVKGRSGGVALYGGARGAQIGYMLNLAQDVAPHVNVNATAQAYVDNPTYFPEEYKNTEIFRQRLTGVPAQRLASMEECAKAVLFLAGPESDFFYGQVIPFTGGLLS